MSGVGTLLFLNSDDFYASRDIVLMQQVLN